ncbi:MAG: hypothetical protein WKF43_07950 [Acidimicrobiales bacterium]
MAAKSGRNKPGAKIKAQPGRAIRILRRRGLRQGILGGNRAWAAVAVGTWGYTQLKRLAQRDVEVVFSEELKPGQRLIISNDRPTVD